MPTNNYHCKNCEYVFEEFRKIEDLSNIVLCPKCKHEAEVVFLKAPSLNLGAKPGMYDKVLPGDEVYEETKERGWGYIP